MILLLLASCSGGKVDIPCAKVTGSQPSLVSVDGNALLTLAGGDDSKSGTMVNLTVKLKRNKLLENLDTAKTEEIQLLSDMVVDVVGKDGSTLCTLPLFGDADKVEFKKMLASGNEAEVTFSKVLPDGDKANDVLKNAAKFTLTTPEMKYPLCLNLGGTVAKKPVQMTLCIGLDHNVKGAYYYKQSGPKALLVLKGSQDEDGEIKLDEYNSDGIFLGTHQLTAKNWKLTGKYDDSCGDSYIRLNDNSISLSPDKSMARIDMSKIDFSYFDKGYRTLFDDIDRWIYCRYGAMSEFKNINYNKIDDYIKACYAVILYNQEYDRVMKTMSKSDQMYYALYMNAGDRSAFLKNFLPRVDVKKLNAAQVQRLNQLKARAKSFYKW